jgi:hypothetical protein
MGKVTYNCCSVSIKIPWSAEVLKGNQHPGQVKLMLGWLHDFVGICITYYDNKTGKN